MIAESDEKIPRQQDKSVGYSGFRKDRCGKLPALVSLLGKTEMRLRLTISVLSYALLTESAKTVEQIIIAIDRRLKLVVKSRSASLL